MAKKNFTDFKIREKTQIYDTSNKTADNRS